jgi:hypothetical protein
MTVAHHTTTTACFRFQWSFLTKPKEYYKSTSTLLLTWQFSISQNTPIGGRNRDWECNVTGLLSLW